MPILPESSFSIIDELKRRGFTPQAGERLPFYGLRQGLYEKSGLKSVLGEFTGTSAQNLKLLENIQKNNLTPQSLGITPTVPVAPVVPGVTPASNTLTTAGTIPQPQRLPTAEELGVPKRISEQDILSQIGQVPGTTAQDVLATASGGLTASIAQEQGQAAIAAGETKAQTTAEKFGSAGLFFSGARVSAEGAVRAEALANKLNIDAGLAKFIVQQQEQGDKETATRIQNIVKDAVGANKEARTEAISALGNLGYVVMPDGSIVQKPSEARAEKSQAIAEQRLQLAQEAAQRAEDKSNELIASEKRTLAVDQLFSDAAREHAKIPGWDGRYSADDYQKALKKFISGGGTESNFYASFPVNEYLRPEEQALLTLPNKRMTAGNIDAGTAKDLQDDINAGFTLQQLNNAYPDVSPALIQSYYYNR